MRLQLIATAVMVIAASIGRVHMAAIAMSVPARPNQAVPGKRNPAAVIGLATPIIPSGGGMLASTARIDRDEMFRPFAVQRRAYGIVRRAAPETQMATPSRMAGFGPKNV